MTNKIEKLQEFYKNEEALVTSPFITQFGQVNSDLLDNVFAQLEIETGKNVGDVGCGSGLLSTYFKKHEYIGLDIVIQSSVSNMNGRHCSFVQGDAQKLPFDNNSLDLITCVDSFEHHPDQNRVVREFYRVLKENGTVFLSVPTYANVAGIVKKVMEKWGGYEKDTWAPFDFWKPEELEHFITPGKIKNVFSSAGFSQFKMIGFADEVSVGMFPWIWHPKMPGKLEKLIRLFFKGIAKPLVRLCPYASLHTFWKIQK